MGPVLCDLNFRRNYSNLTEMVNCFLVCVRLSVLLSDTLFWHSCCPSFFLLKVDKLYLCVDVHGSCVCLNFQAEWDGQHRSFVQAIPG